MDNDLSAENERLRGELTDALNASGSNAKAWQQAVCDEAVKRSQLLAEIGLTEQQCDAATARAEAAERARDEAQAHAADLRGSLEAVDEAICGINGMGNMAKQIAVAFTAINAALARTPAQSLGRLKSEALREAANHCEETELMMPIPSPRTTLRQHGANVCTALASELRDKADRLEKEASDGR